MISLTCVLDTSGKASIGRSRNAATPAPIVARLVAAYADAARSPEIQEWLRTMVLTNVILSPPELMTYIREWRARWREAT